MKKGLLFFAALLLMLGVQAQNPVTDKVDDIKEKLDPATIAGIQMYDTDEFLKKLKVKKPEDKLAVSNLLRNFNNSQETLKSNNKATLGKLGTDIIDIIKGKDFMQIFGSASDYKTNLKAIKNKSEENLGVFETSLFEITKKRQQKKYYKYKTKLANETEKSLDLGDAFSLIGM
jgi:hypothetical protein